jgi:hypothetical protein
VVERWYRRGANYAMTACGYMPSEIPFPDYTTRTNSHLQHSYTLRYAPHPLDIQIRHTLVVRSRVGVRVVSCMCVFVCVCLYVCVFVRVCLYVCACMRVLRACDGEGARWGGCVMGRDVPVRCESSRSPDYQCRPQHHPRSTQALQHPSQISAAEQGIQ